MTAHPTVSEVVATTTTGSHPLLLVSTVTDDRVTAVLLAGVATEMLQYFELLAGDHQSQNSCLYHVNRLGVKPRGFLLR